MSTLNVSYAVFRQPRLILLFNITCVSAAPPSLLPKSTQTSKIVVSGDNQLDLIALLIDLQKKRDSTREELKAQQINPKAQTDPPTSRNHVLPRNFFLQVLIQAYELQIERVQNLQERRQQFTRWQETIADSTNIDTTSPLPFLLDDELKETIRLYNKRLNALNAILKFIEQESLRCIETAEESAAKLRQANEALERSQSSMKSIAAEKAAQALLQNRLDSVRVVGSKIEIERVEQDILELRAKTEQAELSHRQGRIRAPLSLQEMETLRETIQSERKTIIGELENTITELEQSKTGLNSDITAFPTSIATPSHSPEAAVKQTAELRLQALQWMLEWLQIRQLIWEYRWSYATDNFRDQAREAYQQTAQWQHNLKVIQSYVEQMRTLVIDSSTDQFKKSAHFDQLLAHEDIERVKILSRVLAILEANEDLLARWQEDLNRQFGVESMLEYLQDAFKTVKGYLAEIWIFELFTADDVIEVDGQQIHGKRSISLDKIITALLILICGYWLARRLAIFIEQFMIKRFGMDTSLARIARRWILFFETLFLATASLMVAHIPLTIFAFMGGAVAIGAGFGMQNLLKNLISGLMLLLERPFRPGDLVEVGTIRGRITDIGVRSSHIRDGNGIETLIPNSIFIEEKVTNWTLSSQSVRICIKVGVAYHSSVQDVTTILLEAAERHGLVQIKPAPSVLFEDFGNDALIFGLYVWLELRADVDWRVVASDLRYIIYKKFTAKSIAIAFPQRDLHVDFTQPLTVNLSENTILNRAPPDDSR